VNLALVDTGEVKIQAVFRAGGDAVLEVVGAGAPDFESTCRDAAKLLPGQVAPYLAALELCAGVVGLIARVVAAILDPWKAVRYLAAALKELFDWLRSRASIPGV
jgi:hypothetical protein